jgi:hypothetical protein
MGMRQQTFPVWLSIAIDVTPSLTYFAIMSSAVPEKFVQTGSHALRSWTIGFLGLPFAGGLELASHHASSCEEMELRHAVNVPFVVDALLKLINDSILDPPSN